MISRYFITYWQYFKATMYFIFFFASVNLSLTLLFNVKLKFQDGRWLLPVKEHIAWQILNCLKDQEVLKNNCIDCKKNNIFVLQNVKLIWAVKSISIKK